MVVDITQRRRDQQLGHQLDDHRHARQEAEVADRLEVRQADDEEAGDSARAVKTIGCPTERTTSRMARSWSPVRAQLQR